MHIKTQKRTAAATDNNENSKKGRQWWRLAPLEMPY